MSRYDWSQAPEWAMWAATDSCGSRHWYSHRPQVSQDAYWGVYDTDSDWDRAPVAGERFPGPDWRGSLEPRPASAARVPEDDGPYAGEYRAPDYYTKALKCGPMPEGVRELLHEAAVAAEWARQVADRKDIPRAIRDAATGVAANLNTALAYLAAHLSEKE